MTEKKFRLLLTIIFTIGASFLIYNKFAVKKDIKQKAPSINKDINSNQSSKLVDRISSSDDTNNSTTQNIIETFRSCTRLNIHSINRLEDTRSFFDLNDIKDTVIRRNNLIFIVNSKEKRVSITPQEGAQTWKVEFFDVDEEGLPIPTTKTIANSYKESTALAYNKYSKINLTITEVEAQISKDEHYGTALIVNDELTHLTLNNQELGTQLDCETQSCNCY